MKICGAEREYDRAVPPDDRPTPEEVERFKRRLLATIDEISARHRACS